MRHYTEQIKVELKTPVLPQRTIYYRNRLAAHASLRGVWKTATRGLFRRRPSLLIVDGWLDGGYDVLRVHDESWTGSQ